MLNKGNDCLLNYSLIIPQADFEGSFFPPDRNCFLLPWIRHMSSGASRAQARHLYMVMKISITFFLQPLFCL